MGFLDDDYYTGPTVTDAVVRDAEARLGVTLPASYLDVLRARNGGVPVRRCWTTPFATSWADDHFEIRALMGVGGEFGIDSQSQGSPALIEEWGYPPIGVVICDMPSGGHDAVMLDYRFEGREPTVCYVDGDRVPRLVADSFGEFWAGLVECI